MKKLRDNPSWFEGPGFLYDDEGTWPVAPQLPDEVPDTKPDTLMLAVQTEEDPVMKIKFENYGRNRRTLAYTGRFLAKLAKRLNPQHPLVGFMNKHPQSNDEHDVGYDLKINTKLVNVKILTVAELQTGEMLGVKIVQNTTYAQELQVLNKNQALPRQHPLVSLAPFIDDTGLIRVGGRLKKCQELSFNQKHQWFLPKDHPYTIKLFNWVHHRNLHCGPKAIMAFVQQKYWVPRRKLLANSVFNKCVTCFRSKPVTYQEVMGQLPSERTKVVPRAFIHCGVEFCGPFTVHHKGRGSRPTTMYLAIFVCFSTKALHLELVADLSTAAFINCLKRFVYKRGLPLTIWSDNATNFKGAARAIGEFVQLLLRRDHWVQVFEWCLSRGITWKFIPPRTPHFGGLWESAVKSAKNHLVKVAGSAPLHLDELNTLLAMIEAQLNNRLLIPVSTIPGDDTPLTPAHFLIQSSFDEFPEPDLSECNPTQLQKYERVVALKQQFWKKWSREYLATLQNTYKWQQPKTVPKIDDVVLMVDRNVNSKQWKLGRIVQLYPDSSGHIHMVDVKTSGGTYKRGITELCSLPVNKD